MTEKRNAEKKTDARAASARRAAWKNAGDASVRWSIRLGVVALAALAVWGSVEVRRRVRADPRFDLSLWKIELGELPAWAPEEMRSDLALIDLGGSPEGPLTVFTPRVLSIVRERLLSSPWVRSIPRLRLRYPPFPSQNSSRRERANIAADPSGGTVAAAAAGSPETGGIEVEIEVRVPRAAVVAGGACTLADAEGIRLGSPLSLESARALGVVAIVGHREGLHGQPPPPGFAWEDRDVREGIEVARVLHDAGILEEFASGPRIEAIDVSNVAGRARRGECEIVIVCGDLRLGWGRSPISPGARTLPVAEILQNLRRVLQRAREIPGGHQVLLYTSPLVMGPSSASQP